MGEYLLLLLESDEKIVSLLDLTPGPKLMSALYTNSFFHVFLLKVNFQLSLSQHVTGNRLVSLR